MPETLQQMLDRIKAEGEKRAADSNSIPETPAEQPKGNGFTGRQDNIQTHEQINPSQDIFNEAIHNSINEDRVLGENGEGSSFQNLDDATWRDKLMDLDTNGKLLRKTVSYGGNGIGPKLEGKEAQDERNLDESVFGIVPFVGRLFSGQPETNGYYAYKDKNGKYYLREVKGTEEELNKVGNMVYSAYGPKPFSNNVLTNFYKGLSNTINSTDEALVNFAEATTDLGEASINWANGKGFKSEDGALDKYAADLRARNRLENLPTSHASDAGLTSAEGFANGIGSGVGSLLQAGGLGKGLKFAGGIASGFMASEKAVQTMAMLGTGAILNTGEAYTAAKQNNLNEEDAAWLSLATGGVNTVLEQAIGSNKLMKYLVGGGAKEIPETILRETGGKMTAEALDAATPGILKKLMTSVNKITEVPVIGQGLEEGLEEGLQGLTMKTAQTFYDKFAAPDNATPGHGKFGTHLTDSETWKDVFSDALLGGIVGSIGGAAMGKQNRAENETVIPLVAQGKTDQVLASVNILHQSGKLTDYQRDAYTQRVQQIDNLFKANAPIFDQLENKDNAAVLKTEALQSIEDEFHSHQKIDQYMQEIAKINSQPNVSDALKQTKVEQLKERIAKEQEILKIKTAKVRQYIPNAEGKIPAVESMQGKPVEPNVHPKTEEAINNAVINNQREEELAAQEIEKKKAQNDAAADVGTPIPNPVVEEVKPAPTKTPADGDEQYAEPAKGPDLKTLKGIEEARAQELDAVDVVAEQFGMSPEEVEQTKAPIHEKYNKLMNELPGSESLAETPEMKAAQEAEDKLQSEEASGITPEMLKEQEEALKTAESNNTPVSEESKITNRNYKVVRTEFYEHEKNKAEDSAKWVEQMESGKKTPIKVQVVNTKKGTYYNLITKVNGKEVQVAYLPTTEGLTGLHKDASSQTKASFDHMVQLKKAIEAQTGPVDLDYIIHSLIDSGPDRSEAYTTKPLSQLDDRFKFDGDYVIYAQGKRNDSSIASFARVLLGNGEETDFEKINISDAYVLKVRTPNGDVKFIGLETAPLADKDYSELTRIVNDPKMNDETKRVELNKLAFIPSQHKDVNAKFKVTKGDVYISFTPNGVTQGEETGRLLIPKGKQFTAANFNESLKPIKGVGKESIGPLRTQLDEHAQDSVKDKVDILNSLIPTTTEKLWKVYVTAEGIKNTDPVPKETKTPATKEAQEGKPATKKEINNLPTANDILNKPADEDQAGFKIASVEKLQSTDFKQATENIKRILPDFIDVKDITKLAGGIYADGSTMGAFFENCIYLADKSVKGTEYHEAFHAVFRRLLPLAEQQRLIRLGARTARINKADMARFIAQRPQLAEKAETDIFDLMVEEHLADKFMEHMNNKPNNLFKKIFNHIKDFINWVSGNRNDLDSLFHKIDAGVFRNTQVMLKADGSAVEAFKMLPHTSAKESDRIIRLVTALLFKRKEDRIKKKDGSTYYEQYKDKPDEEIIKLIIEERKELESLSKKEAEKIDASKLTIMGLHDGENGRVYKNAYLYPTEITDQVLSMKKYFEVNDDVDSEGDTAADRSNEKNDESERTFDQSIFEFGGFGSVTRDIKQFIGLTIYVDDKNVEQVVDFFTAYSAIERALSGIEDWDMMMAKLMKLSVSSDQIKAIYDKTQTQSNNFKTKFQQAFSKRKIEYKQIIINEETGKYSVFNANKGDIGAIQLSRFKSQFDGKSPAAQIENANAAYKTLESYSRSKSEKTAEQLAKDLAGIGMDIMPEFLKDVTRGENNTYSINGENNKKSLTTDLQAILKQIQEGKNPYIDTDQKKGAQIKVKAIAEADSEFRDDIINSNFQNAEGKTVYTYVLPSHVVVTAQDIQEGKLNKKFESAFYQLNPIVESQKTNKNLFEKLQLTVFNGIREDSATEGVTFKHIDPKTQILSQHLLFKSGHLAPFVFEAKSTSALINIPSSERFYENGKVDSEALQYMHNFVKQDLITITKTMEDLKNLPDSELIENFHFKAYDKNNKPIRFFKLDEKGKPVPVETLEEMLKSVPREKLARGLQVVQFPFLNKYTNEQLADEKIMKPVLEKFAQDQIKQYKELLKINDLDLYDTKNGDIDLFLTKEDSETYKNIDDYLGEFLLKDFIFANAYAQLHRGSEAIYKDAVDITKRAAGQMAGGFPLISDRKNFKVAMIADDFHYIDTKTMQIVDVSKMSEKDLKTKLDNKSLAKVNKTDAQGYMSARRFKEVLRGLGRLSEAAEKQIDALIAGEKIDWNPELFTANSIKNVYFDGTTYIKTSTFPLFREFTSQKDKDGNWVAQEGKERFHNLLEHMENSGIDEIYHESACKLVKKRKNFPNKDGHYDQPLMTIDLENRFWRLQVENPSGKTQIVDGTQLIQLIDSEMDNSKEFTTPDGRTVSVGELRDTYQQMLEDVRQDSMTKASHFLDIMVSGESMFINKLQDTLAESGADNNTIEFFQQLAKEKAEFKYSTDLPNINAKFQELFLSHFTKSVFRQKTAGSKFSLVTSSGYLHEGRPLKIHKVENGKLEYAECVISEEILKTYGITREEFEKNTSEKDKQEILTMLGFRIPTQSHHSMIPFKVVGWLPAYYGSVIIAPAEITYLSGADYDIDSLFVQRKEFAVVGKEGSKKAVVYSDNKSDEKLYKDFLEYELKQKDAQKIFNKFRVNNPDLSQKELIAMTMKTLKLPTTFEEFQQGNKLTNAARYNKMLDTRFDFLNNPEIHESLFTPASIDSLKDVAADISAVTGRSEDSGIPYNWASSRFNHWLNNSVGKANVGNAANANIASAWLTRYKVKMGYQTIEGFIPITIDFDGKQYKNYENNMEEDIDFIKDKNGKPTGIAKEPVIRRKADSLSTLVSAMTDNAKERLAAKLNLTRYNLSTFSNMVALGMGLNRSMLFASQPVLLELTNRLMSANSLIGGDELASGVADQMLLELAANIKAAPESMDITSEEMLKHLNYKMGDAEDQTGLVVQYKVLEKFIFLSSIAEDMGKINKLLSTNKAIGVDFQEFDSILEALDSVQSSSYKLDIGEGLSNDKNLQQNLTAVSKINKKLSDYFMSRTEGFQKTISHIKDLGLKRSNVTKLYTDLVTFYGMQKLNKTIKGGPIENFKPLIADKTENIVAQKDGIIAKNPELQDNLFLRQLNSQNPETSENKNPYYRLEFNGRIKTDPRFIEKLTDGFRELQNHPNLEVRDFARNLARYLIVKDNLKFVNNSFIRLLPPKTLEPYSDILKQVKEITSKDMGDSNIFKSDFNKEMLEHYSKDWYEMQNDFERLWYSQKDNAKSLNQFLSKLPEKALSGVTKGTDNTIIVNLKGKEDLFKNGLPGFPKFFAKRVPSRDSNGEYISVLQVWERDRYIKDGDKKVGGVYKRVKMNDNKFQAPYHTEQSIKESKAEKLEVAKDESNLVEKLPSKAESLLIKSPNGHEYVASINEKGEFTIKHGETVVKPNTELFNKIISTYNEVAKLYKKACNS